MKRKTRKIYLKIGILFFGISVLLFNCTEEKEFLNEPQVFGLFNHTHQKVRIVKKQNIPTSIFDFIDFRTSGTGKVILNKQTEGYTLHSGSTKNNTFGTIDDSKSVVVSLETQTRYTFLVQPSEPSTDEVVNLVIIDDGIQTLEYFVKYEFDSNSQVASAFNTIDMMEFEGTISFYNDEGVLIGNYTMSQGRTTKSSGTGISCDPNDDTTTDDPNDNTSSNDSGSGNGGCTNCGGDDSSNDTQEPGDDSDGGTTSGGGEFCSVEIKYYRCNCGGDANGHPPSGEACCEGSPMTVTITCNEYAGRTSSSSESNVVPFSCDSPIGAIVDKNNCDSVNQQVTGTDFKNRISELETKMDQPNETGYIEDNTGNYPQMELANDDGSSLKFPISNTIKGFMHNHSGPWIDIDPDTGEEDEAWPVNMFSSTDMRTFLNLLENNDGAYFENSELYSALVTFEGNYILKFAGEVPSFPQFPENPNNNKSVKFAYRLLVELQENKVIGLLQFMKSYGVTNLVMYEFNDLGVLMGHYYDENGDYKTIECN